MKCLQTRRRAYKHSPINHNLSHLQHAEEQFQQIISEAKANYESSLISNYTFGATSVIYRYIRSLSKTQSMPSTVYLGIITATCDESKAKLFNLYFHSVFNKASQPIPEYDTIEQNQESVMDMSL